MIEVPIPRCNMCCASMGCDPTIDGVPAHWISDSGYERATVWTCPACRDRMEHAGNATNATFATSATFATGAVRGTDAAGTRYDLITPVGLRRVATAYAEGAQKYDEFNWEKGIPISDLLNHALRHIFMFLGGDRSEDHLGHASWNVLAACHSEERWPDLNRVYLAGIARRALPEVMPAAPRL